MQKGCWVNGCFLNNCNNVHAHWLLPLMILCNFISLWAFTVYMIMLLRFEISMWNLHQSEFHFAWSHMNADNEVTLHRVEISPQKEISNQFWAHFRSHVNMLIEKGLLAASWSKPLLIKSMEENPATWRFLLNSKGLKYVAYFHKKIDHAQIEKITVTTLHKGSSKFLQLMAFKNS